MVKGLGPATGDVAASGPVGQVLKPFNVAGVPLGAFKIIVDVDVKIGYNKAKLTSSPNIIKQKWGKRLPHLLIIGKEKEDGTKTIKPGDD